MKTIERILLTSFFIATGTLLIWNSALDYFLFTGLVTVLFYFYFSFILLNNIPLKKVFNRNSYHNTSILKIIGSALMGILYSACVVCLIFKMVSWPGTVFMIFVAIMGIIISSVIILIKRKSSPLNKDFYTKILVRNLIFIVPALLSLLLFTNGLRQ